MSDLVDAAIRALRAEVQRLTVHPEDRVFMVLELDRFQAFMRELEEQHAAATATVGTMSDVERRTLANEGQPN